MRLRKFLLLISVSLFAFSCTKEEPFLSVDKEIILFEDNGGEQLLVLNSNTVWQLAVRGNVELNVNPKSGESGTSIISVKALPNTANFKRTSTLTFSAAEILKDVHIFQDSLDVEFSLYEDGEPFDGTLEFSSSGETKKLEVKSNISWNINTSNLPKWLTIQGAKGSGDSEIYFSVARNTDRTSGRSYKSIINYGTQFMGILLNQDSAVNHIPTVPSDLVPANNAQNISVNPKFSWSASYDEDGDEVSYLAKLSKDNQNWTEIYEGTSTAFTLSSVGIPKLDFNSTYYFKVAATDGYMDGYVESQVVKFTTSATQNVWQTGEFRQMMQSAKPYPSVLVFTGDGYTEEDLEYGGSFDSDIDKAIDEFFSVEPYKTYKEYFTVYKLAAESKDRGVTITAKNIRKDTYFECVLEGGGSTGIDCNDEKVFDLVENCSFATNIPSSEMSVCIVINEDEYAGTCISWSSGECIAMVPVCISSSTNMTKFGNVIIHEFGGHGYGRLSDEYRYYDNATKDVLDNIQKWQGYGFGLNLSLTSIYSQTPWASFENLPDYDHVGVYEGGGLYRKGIWRSEFISCMEDNRKYYNSQSRFLIVKRILETAKEVDPILETDSDEVKAAKMALLMDLFQEKDYQKTDNTELTSNTQIWGGVPYEYKPLTNHILIER